MTKKHNRDIELYVSKKRIELGFKEFEPPTTGVNMLNACYEDVLKEVLTTLPAKPYLFKEDLAGRYGMSVKTIDSKCSKTPNDLPLFTKASESPNSKILFPRRSVAEFEARRIWDAQQRRKSSSVPDRHLADSDDLLNLL